MRKEITVIVVKRQLVEITVSNCIIIRNISLLNKMCSRYLIQTYSVLILINIGN